MAIISGSTPSNPVSRPTAVANPQAPAGQSPPPPAGAGDTSEVVPRTPGMPPKKAEDTGVEFRPIRLKRFDENGQLQDAPVPPELQGAVNEAGEFDLKRVTPEMFNSMSQEDREAFLVLLSQQNSAGNPHVATSDNAPTNIMGLDKAFMLHLLRQDTSGHTAAELFALNPERVEALHSALSAGSDPAREDANNLALTLFSHLDEVLDGRAMDGRLSKVLSRIASDHVRINEQDPETAMELLSRADEATSRMPEETAHYNAGALAATILAGVRDSGTNPLAFLSGGPAKYTPAGLVTALVGNALQSWTDTTDDADRAYEYLFSRIRDQFSEQSRAAGNDPVALRHALDQRDGFIAGMDWND